MMFVDHLLELKIAFVQKTKPKDSVLDVSTICKQINHFQVQIQWFLHVFCAWSWNAFLRWL